MLSTVQRVSRAEVIIESNSYSSIGSGLLIFICIEENDTSKIVKEMISGLSQWMDEKNYENIDQFVGKALPNVTDWQYLNLNHITKARIDQDLCIQCGRCYAACEDTSHQAISMSEDRVFDVKDDECVACNLCVNVCPVENCITMETLAVGEIDERTGKKVSKDYGNWTTHPNNPMANAAE